MYDNLPPIQVIRSTDRSLAYTRIFRDDVYHVSIIGDVPLKHASGEYWIPAARGFVLVNGRTARWLQGSNTDDFDDCSDPNSRYELEVSELPEVLFTEARFYASQIAEENASRALEPLNMSQKDRKTT